MHGSIIVYQKELRDILRDRRTIISMILVPIILFPVLLFGSVFFIELMVDKIKEKTSKVVWIGPPETDFLKEEIFQFKNLELFDLKTDSSQAVELIKDKQIEALVIIPDDFVDKTNSIVSGGVSVGKLPVIDIYTLKTRDQASFTANQLEGALSAYRNEITRKALQEKNVPIEIIKPFDVEQINIATPKEMGSKVAGQFLPYILILMALTGAMYPAIDLTAGEKERGTMETLLVSGIARINIVLGKFYTVFTASVVTAFLSILSMSFTGAIALKWLERIPEFAGIIDFKFGLNDVGLMIIAMLPLCAIFSSLLMTLSLFAKSFREAQSYISPLMFLVIFPAMSSLMPGVEASKNLAVIPVINVSMLLKDGFAGEVDPMITILTMLVNLVLAAFGLLLVVRMFKRESVLFRI